MPDAYIILLMPSSAMMPTKKENLAKFNLPRINLARFINHSW